MVFINQNLSFLFRHDDIFADMGFCHNIPKYEKLMWNLENRIKRITSR